MKSAPVVLVTGASQGIGRAIAARLARAGCRVFGTSRSPERVAPLAGVTYLPLDLHDPVSIQACVDNVLSQAGQLDVLVNNAGRIGPAAAVEEIDLERIRQLFETNFFGLIAMTNAVLPVFRRQRCGRVINISSAGGKIAAPPFFTMYAASKHAVEAYSEGLYYEARPFNIHVTMIEPGYTHTDIGDSIDRPDHPLADYAEARGRIEQLDRAALLYGSAPEAVAEAVWRAIRQPRPALRIPVGTDSQSILLARRWLPDPLFTWLVGWIYLGWRPPRTAVPADPNTPLPIPTVAELGIRGYLFHTRLLQKTLWVTGGMLLAGLSAWIGLRRSKRPHRR